MSRNNHKPVTNKPNNNILIKVDRQTAINISEWFKNPPMPFIHFDVRTPNGLNIRVEFEHPGLGVEKFQ